MCGGSPWRGDQLKVLGMRGRGRSALFSWGPATLLAPANVAVAAASTTRRLITGAMRNVQAELIIARAFQHLHLLTVAAGGRRWFHQGGVGQHSHGLLSRQVLMAVAAVGRGEEDVLKVEARQLRHHCAEHPKTVRNGQLGDAVSEYLPLASVVLK